MKKLLLLSMLALSSTSLAGPPKTGPARWEALDPEERAERQEERAKKARMMLLVSVAEALELTEAQALKLSDKLKALDEKRRPVREAMHEAMRAVKAAADGDQSALAALDQNVQRVLDGRVQIAQLDKELYASLAEGQTPQKKARLAVVLAKVGHELRGGKGRHLRE
ncbi:MAG: hypothetical protein JNJ54_13240 [Myxococcaceae bacterium]|nr:hypothetical protein [Myxococcaceae bacterium]